MDVNMKESRNPFRSNYEELSLDHLCQPITTLINMHKRKMPMILFAFYCPICLFWELLIVTFGGWNIWRKWYKWSKK